MSSGESEDCAPLLEQIRAVLENGPDRNGTACLLALLGHQYPPALLDCARIYADYLPVPPSGGPMTEEERYLSLVWEALDRSFFSLAVNVAFPVRRMIAERLFASCGRGFIACEGVRFNFGRNLSVGDEVFINAGTFLDAKGGITIGDRAGIAESVRIFTHGHGEDDHAERAYARVVIGDDVKVGAGATILPGVTIGDEALVAAGAVVSRDLPPGGVAAGIPARIVRERRTGGRHGRSLNHIWLVDGAFQE
jgi:acetyltransferase-like isoleucine patch superfamily enzyme